MRHFAITGMDTVAMISRIFFGEAIRATPPSARICAGTRSRAITATAPAFSAMAACSALVTSMITPPFSISARPVFRRRLVLLPLFWDMGGLFSGKQLSALSRQLSANPTSFYSPFMIRGTPHVGGKTFTTGGTGEHRVNLALFARPDTIEFKIKGGGQ